jgi:hypothetical protein
VLRLEVLPLDRAARPDPVTLAPDLVRLGFDGGAEFTVLAELDGHYLSTEVTGGFTGCVIVSTPSRELSPSTGSTSRPFPGEPLLR